MVAPLAVWKAGGAYVPLDPEYPGDRLAFMLEDSAAAVLVTESRLLDGCRRDVPGLICLDRERQALERESAGDPAPRRRLDNLAYVIYTSGSTGKPKGVEIQASLAGKFSVLDATPTGDVLDRIGCWRSRLCRSISPAWNYICLW